MSKNLKAASLAAAIALAMGSTAAWGATAPTATQLPGKGAVTSTTGTGVAGTVNATTSTLAITTGGGNSVITWGSGSDINASGTAGFNVGSSATVNFTGGGAVLNIDSTSNPSQILGTMTSDGSLYVANKNGIIVGKDASITATGALGLIANNNVNTDLFAATGNVPTYDGAGGDVTVSGSLTGSTVLVSGGGTVNVDLAQIHATTSSTLQAGIHTSTTSGSKDNPAATLNLSNSGGSSYSAKGDDVIASAGNITTAGTLDLSAIGSTEGSSLSVGGSLTNTGDLTVADVDGAVVNQKTLTVTANGTLGGLTNAGEATLGGALKVTGGDLVNQGKITGATGGSAITVTDGNLNNSGLLSGVTSLATASDADFTAGADYSITNSGAIEAAGTGELALNANNFADARPVADATGKVKNDTTGSIANTGNIYLGTATGLTATAYNDLTLGGLLFAGATPAPVTSDDAWTGAVSLTANGALTVTAPIYVTGTNNNVTLTGSVVRAMADVSSATGNVAITAGGAVDGDYAVRVAKGATVSGASVTVAGGTADDDSQLYPNVILQGTVAGNKINFENVSDVFSGPAGGLLVTAGTNPTVEFDFTGRIKTAPYLNASNFRYNYLPIDFGKGVTKVGLTLNPVAYKTNGTDNGKAAVNILVNGDVNLTEPSTLTSPVSPNGTAVTGVNPVANTHLVLQSTGDISTGTGAFYWPGYVYLGTVDADADGNALPGTLGLGSISLGSQFSNVLPGDVSGASGIHFMTQLPLTLTSTKILTNANAWVNFPTDALTQLYVAMNAKSPFVYSGQTSANSKVVTYLPADGSVFHTHPVDSSK